MIKTEKRLWILEDDPESLFVYQQILGLHYLLEEFQTLASLSQSIELLQRKTIRSPDLLIADLRLSDGHFLSFLLEDPKNFLRTLPILIISSCDDLNILRDCFNEGVTDYLIKPYQKSELIIKVERMVNQSPQHYGLPPPPEDLTYCKFKPLSPCEYKSQYPKEALTLLTARELQIFSILFSAKGKAISRRDLTTSVWKKVHVGEKTLDVHIFNLRRKLEATGYQVFFIPPESYTLNVVEPNRK